MKEINLNGSRTKGSFWANLVQFVAGSSDFFNFQTKFKRSSIRQFIFLSLREIRIQSPGLKWSDLLSQAQFNFSKQNMQAYERDDKIEQTTLSATTDMNK